MPGAVALRSFFYFSDVCDRFYSSVFACQVNRLLASPCVGAAMELPADIGIGDIYEFCETSGFRLL
jgi:hypothetical protein